MKHKTLTGVLICILATGAVAGVSVIDTISIGPTVGNSFFPGVLAVNTTTNRIYVLTSEATSFLDAVSVIDGATDSVVSLIPLDTEEIGRSIAVNSKTNRIYVRCSEYVSVIDGSADTVINVISLPSRCSADLAINPLTNLIYVLQGKDSTSCILYVIDGATNAVVDSISTPMVSEVCVNYWDNQMYMICPFDSQVIVMDMQNNEIIDSVILGSTPMDIVANWESGRVYVSLRSKYTVTDIIVIDASTNSITDTVSVKPKAMTVDITRDRLYVMDTKKRLLVVDGATSSVVDTIEANWDPRGIAINSQTGLIYVTSYVPSTVCVVGGKTSTLISQVVLGRSLDDIALDSLSKRAYVTSAFPGDIAVIDLTNGSFVDVISLGDYHPQMQIQDIAVNPLANRLYVQRTSQEGDGILVRDLSTGLLLASIFVGDTPYCQRVIAVNSNTNRVYVATTDGVCVIDGVTNSLIGTIPVSDPWGVHCVTVNPTNNYIYAPGRCEDIVYVIDGATDSLILCIPIEDNPSDITINPNTNRMYVTGWSESGGGKLSVIDCATHSLIATITHWWGAPDVIVANPTNNRIYVWEWEKMYVIDGATNVIVDSVIMSEFGDSPRFRAYSCEIMENKLYVPTLWVGVIVLEDDMAVQETPRQVSGTRLEVYPNPSGSSVFIKFTLGVSSRTSLKIYDAVGRLIKTFSLRKEKAGCLMAEWDGKSASGKKVPSGIYFCTLEAGDFKATEKFVVF